MRRDQSVIIKIPLVFNRHAPSPPHYSSHLFHYTSQLKALLNSPPKIDNLCTTDTLKAKTLDNYLCSVGEVINNIYQLKSRIQKETQDQSENHKVFTRTP